MLQVWNDCQLAPVLLQELESLQQGMRRLQERVAQQDATVKQHEKRLLQAVQVSPPCQLGMLISNLQVCPVHLCRRRLHVAISWLLVPLS